MLAISNSIKGAIIFVLAGVFFTAINALTPMLAGFSALSASTVAFYQYLLAFIFLLPKFWLEDGLATFRTKHLWAHLLRVVLCAIGIQCWVTALVQGVPIWQGIALLMTSPIFVVFGSATLLKEKVDASSWLVMLAGFIGAMIILNPLDENFTWLAALPLLAAFCWAIYSLLIKKLSYVDSANTMVFYLFLLIIPLNLLFAASSLSWPTQLDWYYLVAIGALTAAAQYAIAKAYDLALASFLQPFDYVKLLLNIFAGWWLFGYVPPGVAWLGAGIIVVATAYLTKIEYSNANKLKAE